MKNVHPFEQNDILTFDSVGPASRGKNSSSGKIRSGFDPRRNRQRHYPPVVVGRADDHLGADDDRKPGETILPVTIPCVMCAPRSGG
jgi:hypothetical protein